MSLTFSDEVISQTGMSAELLRVEIACPLFEAGKISLKTGRDIAGLGRLAFEDELIARKIPIYYYTLEDLDQDLKTIEKWK